MAVKTPIEISFDMLNKRKKPVKFSEIIALVKEKLELSDEQTLSMVGDFINDLILDPRFVYVGNDSWTLRNRVRFDDIKKADITEDEKGEDVKDEDEDEDDSQDEFSGDEYDNALERSKSSDDEEEEV